MQPPSAEHWFGVDNTGRDMLSRVLFGARNTLMMGLAGVLIGGMLGAVLGILAAYYKRVDPWIMRVVDIMLAFPAILIGLAVAAIFGAGLAAVVIALVVSTVPDVARVARGAAVGVMGQEFMEAGRAVRGVQPHADLALPHAQLHLHHLGVHDAALWPGHPGGLGLGLSRHGRPAARGRAGHDGRAGTRLSLRGAAPSPPFPAWPSSSSCSPPTCWAMRCAMCSTRACSSDRAATAGGMNRPLSHRRQA